MGAAASLVERAWRVRRGRDDLLVLTRAEVAEDEACLAAQRAAIRYCREHIYYGAPVRVSAVRSAAHHLPTALVSLDSARAAPGAAQDGPRGGAAAVAGYPEACVVSPAGDIVVARRGGAPGRRVIRAATLAAATDPPAPPVLRPAAGGGGGAALGVAWAAPGGADAAAVVDRYEVQHRGAAGGGGGGTSPVGWRALGAVEPQRGDAHEAWARGVAPGGNALVVHRGADEEDEEVEAPHHLREPQQREVFADVVVREVAEARHPDVRRDVDPDRVVDLRRLHAYGGKGGWVYREGMWGVRRRGSRDRIERRRRTAK